jgi:hypothetical protein
MPRGYGDEVETLSSYLIMTKVSPWSRVSNSFWDLLMLLNSSASEITWRVGVECCVRVTSAREFDDGLPISRLENWVPSCRECCQS